MHFCNSHNIECMWHLNKNGYQHHKSKDVMYNNAVVCQSQKSNRNSTRTCCCLCWISNKQDSRIGLLVVGSEWGITDLQDEPHSSITLCTLKFWFVSIVSSNIITRLENVIFWSWCSKTSSKISWNIRKCYLVGSQISSSG